MGVDLHGYADRGARGHRERCVAPAAKAVLDRSGTGFEEQLVALHGDGGRSYLAKGGFELGCCSIELVI
jgi:hypothetical protein